MMVDEVCFINLGSDLYQLRIKTKCGSEWAGTNDLLSFKFCSDGNCCTAREIRSRMSLDMDGTLYPISFYEIVTKGGP